MLKGMVTTIGHLFRPNFNDGYPYVRKTLPERARMSFALGFADDGSPLCKSCGLCERSCPDGAIAIASSKREDGPGRVLERFEIDLGLCMFCGLCVESCPSEGLAHTGYFEVATPDRDSVRLKLWPPDETRRP